MNPRRSFFRSVLGLGTGAVALSRESRAQQVHSSDQAATQQAHVGPTVPVVTPDIADLPFTIDNGVKAFHLIAEPVKQVIIPGRTFDLWGFNGSAPGPTIQANEGDRLRIVFENHLPEPTGIHWHGLELPIEMDGVPGIGQKPVMPGRALRLRVFTASERHLLLSLAHGHAGDGGNARRLHHPPEDALYAPSR